MHKGAVYSPPPLLLLSRAVGASINRAVACVCASLARFTHGLRNASSRQGPPNAQKTPVSSSASGLGATPPGETSYELLLQQQQLFLQWQLEWQHKVVYLILE